jgi:hypothetical protein
MSLHSYHSLNRTEQQDENGTRLSSLDNRSQEELCAVTSTDDRARLRAATERLRAEGIPNAEKLLRIGAAVMLDRCVAAWRQRPDAPPAVLAQMVMQGGPSDQDMGYRSERRRIVGEMNAWQRGYREAS